MVKQSVDCDKLSQIIALFEEHRSERYIAAKLGISKTCVHNTICKYRATGLIEHQKGAGRPKKLSESVSRRLIRLCKEKSSAKSAELAFQLSTVTGVSVHSSLVRKFLCNQGYKSRTAQKRINLTRYNVQKRLLWCRARRDWTTNDWKKVIFTDESTFQLFPNRRIAVRRLPNEMYDLNCIKPKMHSGGGKVTVWGGVSWYGYTDLHICTENVTQQYYVYILQEKLVPFMEDEMPLRGSMFQQDNSLHHTALSTRRWLEMHNIKCLEWPAQSPDLNIIEIVWKVLKDRVEKKKPQSIQQLKDVLIEEWKGLSLTFAKHLIQSMPCRIASVITSKGYHIKG